MKKTTLVKMAALLHIILAVVVVSELAYYIYDLCTYNTIVIGSGVDTYFISDKMVNVLKAVTLLVFCIRSLYFLRRGVMFERKNAYLLFLYAALAFAVVCLSQTLRCDMLGWFLSVAFANPVFILLMATLYFVASKPNNKQAE